MNNCRVCKTGTPARFQLSDVQECPSYRRFATFISWSILRHSFVIGYFGIRHEEQCLLT